MTEEINLIGLCCSVPHLIVYNKLRKISKNETIIVLTDDTTVLYRDIIPLAEKFKCKIELSKVNDVYRVTLTKL
ncbi:MAG: sulfurtransferase TusA family protein [Sulfolobaceae archaeon]|jgi:tRNA 2-thiouridine synthesizing protein A|nr:sulfurtransferase TusA family protein [Sulfolobaceae archaeon]